jgi:hypothetical protein
LNVATPLFAPYVVTVTIVIIVGLFMIQSRGTLTPARLQRKQTASPGRFKEQTKIVYVTEKS